MITKGDREFVTSKQKLPVELNDPVTLTFCPPF